MRILFLDIDGVLNGYRITRPKNPYSTHANLDWMHQPCVDRFINLVEVGEVDKIVLSSTWRLVWGIEHTQTVLERYGCVHKIADRTPFAEGDRHNEIRQYLTDNPIGPYDRFMILDDERSAGRHPDVDPYFVQTDGHWGLQDGDVEVALRILNGGTR